MGKKNNIKRAKRLTEAKRKRELDDSIASGNGPGSKEIKKRVESKGGEVRLNKEKTRYSELLKSFVKPLLENNDSIEIIRNKFTLGSTIWNAATLREKNEEAFLSARNRLVTAINSIPNFEILFDEMVKRKQDEFSEYKNIILDFEIKKLKGLDYELSIATTLMDD